jgi:hypothetical protein
VSSSICFARSQTAGFLQDALVELACGPGEKDPQQLAAMAECQTQAAQLVSASTNTSTTSALGELAVFGNHLQLLYSAWEGRGEER